MSPSAAFWALITATTPGVEHPEAHASAISDHLAESGLDATLAFARDFDEAISGLYTWDLWGAAYLALGGCSDDTFEYLRAWLVGNGETTWALGAYEPEALFLRLLESSPDSESLGARLDQGEHLLYAAGRAHEVLTGRWPEPAGVLSGEPTGEPWEEEDLAFRFPDLYLASDWSVEAEHSGVREAIALIQRLSDGLDAAATGNHGLAEEILRPVFDDPEKWAVIAGNPDSRVGVAYALGIGDLLAGRVDRAANTFRRVEGDLGEHDELRRGLAQVELSRGALDAAAALLDSSPDASRFDRILTGKLWWRQGETDLAVVRATQELDRPRSREDHPWDVAGALLQAGHILVEAGLAEPARRAARAMKPLLRKAPDDLELVVEWRLLEASVERLRGRPEKALDHIASVDRLTGYSEATWHKERARALRALGQEPEALVEFSAAVVALDRAGERWEAAALRAESGG